MSLKHYGEQSSFTEKPKQVSEQIVKSCKHHVINCTFEVQVGVAFWNVLKNCSEQRSAKETRKQVRKNCLTSRTERHEI